MRWTLRRRLRAAVPAGVLAAAASLTGCTSADHADPRVTGSAKAAFERAMVLNQRVVVPVRAPGSRQSAAMLAAAMLAATRAGGERRLAAVFTGAALEHERAVLDGALGQQRDASFRVLGGGARGFAYHRVDVVSDTRVVLIATFSEWSRIAQVRTTDGRMVAATPTSLVDVRATVDKGADGVWKVSSYTWTFHPGSEP